MTNADTVRFNVGGREYRVAKSLIEHHSKTMLCRLASDAWTNTLGAAHQGADPIFIERDGERFRYCLDYLRDGRAVLPWSESREAVLHEFDYYGIDCDPARLTKDQKSFPDAVDLVSSCYAEINSGIRSVKMEIAGLNLEIEDRERKLEILDLTMHCLQTYCQKNILQFTLKIDDTRMGDYMLARPTLKLLLKPESTTRTFLEEQLRKFGLEIQGMLDEIYPHGFCHMYLKKLT
eukprot:gene10903-12900_t